MVAAVAMFAAASCTQELENNAPEAKDETVVYTASTDGADTKAVLNETTKKSEWVANDAITVHDGEKGWTFTAAEAGANVDFSNSEGFGDYRPVLAVYPAGTYTVDVAKKTVNAYIPTYQPARKGTYNEGAALAVAYSENDQFAFKNAHSLIKFTIKSSNIKAIEFYGNNEEAITGNMLVSLNTDYTVKSVEGQDTVFEEGTDDEWTGKGTWVKIYSEDEANGWCFENGATYYAAVAPVNFTKGVAINYILSDDTKVEAVKKTDNPVNLTPSKILNIGDLEYEAPVVYEWAVAGTFNEWSTTANPMELVDGYYVAKNITGLNYSDPNEGETGSSTGIKFVNNGDWKGGEGQVTAGTWAYVWGDGGNIYVDGATADTAYDIYLNPSEGDYGKFVIVAAGATMPEDKPATAQEWYLVGDFNNWTAADANYKMALDGEWYVFENFTADGKKVKFVADADWKINRGGSFIANQAIEVTQDGSDMSVPAGNYDVYLSADATIAYFMNPGLLPGEAPEPEQPEVDASAYGLVGSFQGWNVASPIEMTNSKDGWIVAENVELYKVDEFKFVKDKSWDVSYGTSSVTVIEEGQEFAVQTDNSQNMKVSKNGKFNLYFNPATLKVKVECVDEYANLTVNITIDNKANWSPLYIYLESDGEAITPAEGALVSNNVYAVSGDYIGSTLTCKLISGSKVSEVMNVAITKDGATVTLEETIIKLKVQLNTANAKQWWGNTMKIHVWDTGTSFDTSWPGNTMTSEGNYTWSIIVPSELVGKTINYLIHNGNGWQSSDSTVTISVEGNIVTGSSIGIN